MSVALDVDEKTAARLRELAAAGGISVQQLLATYVPGLDAPKFNGNGAGSESVISAFEEWANSFPQDVPPLLD